MPVITLQRPKLMQWNANAVTEHNRGPLEISVERIERSQRMANGLLRTYHIADKRTFSVSWENVPRTTANTVDGAWGADAMKDFYEATTIPFTLKVSHGDGSFDNYTVVFSSFSATISKRGSYDMWNVSCEMTEV